MLQRVAVCCTVLQGVQKKEMISGGLLECVNVYVCVCSCLTLYQIRSVSLQKAADILGVLSWSVTRIVG